MDRLSLKGKKAFVTGGARGIGKSVALAFCEAGADVALVDKDIEEAQKTAAQLKTQTGSDTIALSADITCPEQVQEMTAALLAHFGRIDIALCNAGICINASAEDMSFEQWKSVMDVNLTGVFLTAQAAGKVMLKQGSGSIINVASMSAHIVNIPQKQCAYNASKAGVVQLTKSLAVEWATRGVRVNSISPGYTATELVTASKTLEPMIPQWCDLSPTGRLAKPEELQGMCVYLASDAASFTTGGDFVVDGAFTAV